MSNLIGYQSRPLLCLIISDFSIPVCHSKVCRCPSICRSYVGREFWFQGLVVHQCALGRAHERPVQRRSKYRRRDRRGLATGDATSHSLRIEGLNLRLMRRKLLFFHHSFQADILDAFWVKLWGIKYATKTATDILKIDQIIMAKPAGGPKPRDPGAGMDQDDD